MVSSSVDFLPSPSVELLNSNELKLHNCSNCVLRSYSLCEHDIHDNELFRYDELVDGRIVKHRGLCPEYTAFILSFRGVGDTVLQMWEKFYLNLARMISLTDNSEYLRLSRAITLLSSKVNPDLSELNRLRDDRNNLKFWVTKVLFEVLKAHGKINDREHRVTRGKSLSFKANEINFGSMKALE